MPASTYGRQVVLALTNQSGAGVIAGDVVVIDTTNNDAFTTNAAGAFLSGVGIAQETIANLATGRVLTSGYAALVNVNAAVTRGNFGKTHTVVKQAVDAGATRGVGTFCQWLTGGTTPDALVYPVDLLGSSLTNPMTTLDDIIKGGAAGAPARLAVGAAGGALSVINAAVAWNSGTSFPASKLTGDRFWRTDLGMEFYYDGTRWVTTSLLTVSLTTPDVSGIQPISANGALGRAAWLGNGYAIYVVGFYGGTFTAATNNGTNYWTFDINSKPSATALGSFNTSADTASVHTPHAVAINTVVAITEADVVLSATKTGTPGAAYWGCTITYRIITT